MITAPRPPYRNNLTERLAHFFLPEARHSFLTEAISRFLNMCKATPTKPRLTGALLPRVFHLPPRSRIPNYAPVTSPESARRTNMQPIVDDVNVAIARKTATPVTLITSPVDSSRFLSLR